MSFRANRLRHSPPDDEGYILPTVIVVLTIGAMVAIALLGYAAALLKAGGDDADSVLHLYAADAGITTMKHRLEQGTVTTPSQFMFGDVKVEVTSTTTTRAPGQYRTTVLQPDLLDEDPVIVIIEDVPQDTQLDVHWQYILPHILTQAPTNTTTTPGTHSPAPTPTAVPPAIEVYVHMGPQIEGTPRPTPIVTSVPCHLDDRQDDQRGCVKIEEPLDLPKRMEDIRFVFPPGEDEVSTLPFARTCTDRRIRSHFCLTAASLDYVVVSTTDSATVTAYIRQFPGWCESPSGGATHYERCDDVRILSWKPYANPTPIPNSDDEQDEPTDAPDE